MRKLSGFRISLYIEEIWGLKSGENRGIMLMLP